MRALVPLIPIVLVACTTEVTPTYVEQQPVAEITSPDSGATFMDSETIEFLATVSDGNGLQDIQSATWTSSEDGELDVSTPDGAGTVRLSTQLTAGNHTIELTVVDNSGNQAIAAITVVVEQDAQAPSVVITAPLDNGFYVNDLPIALQGIVSDRQQSPATLTLTWAFESTGGGARTVIAVSSADASGATSAEWTNVNPGAWRVILEATDQDGNVGTDTVAITVADPDDADQDGDGYVGLLDCDDLDDNINPGEDERCNGIDDDCSGVADDKDLDGDGHVDQSCALYAGAMPLDDCNDAQAFVYPGALEQADGTDNDCDGEVDEGTNLYDDDGDCFCESAVLCWDSINPACFVLGYGDCNDADAALNQQDADLDGFTTCEGDCDDTDATLTLHDFDFDGFTTCDGDCNDFNAALTPATCP